ncbi:hypothetical protein ACKWTF_014966 [Chironomus riparius]
MEFSKLTSTFLGFIIILTSKVQATPFEIPQEIHNKLFEATELSHEIVWAVATVFALSIVAVITCIVLKPKQCCRFISYLCGFIFGCSFLVIFIFALIMLIAFMKDHYEW